MGSSWIDSLEKFLFQFAYRAEKVVNTGWIDCVRPMCIHFERRADDESVCFIVELWNVVLRDAGTEKHGQLAMRFGFSYIAGAWRFAGGAAGDDHAVGTHEFGGFSRLAKRDVGSYRMGGVF